MTTPFDRETREMLAREVHADYVRRVREIEGYEVERPQLANWDDLAEDLREANRRQVDDIPYKLEQIDASVVPLEGGTGLFIFSLEEIEMLAEHEHRRWMDERSGQGWQYGSIRDVVAKTHPRLVPYAELEEAEREKDRDAVRRIPTLLAFAGLAIVRELGA